MLFFYHNDSVVVYKIRFFGQYFKSINISTFKILKLYQFPLLSLNNKIIILNKFKLFTYGFASILTQCWELLSKECGKNKWYQAA